MPARGEVRGSPPYQARDSTTAVISVSCSLSLSVCVCAPLQISRVHAHKRVPPEILSSDSGHQLA